jgi:acyl dehydratase
VAPRHFEDCSVGDRLTTGGRTVTETDVVMFAAVSGDWNALHTDAEAAREGPYGERIAHGMLTLVIGMNLLFRQGNVQAHLLPSELVAVTGYETVKFLQPVKIGDTLRVDAEIVSARRIFVNQGLLGVRFRVLNQRTEAVAAGRLSVLVHCRPAELPNGAVGGQ